MLPERREKGHHVPQILHGYAGTFGTSVGTMSCSGKQSRVTGKSARTEKLTETEPEYEDKQYRQHKPEKEASLTGQRETRPTPAEEAKASSSLLGSCRSAHFPQGH